MKISEFMSEALFNEQFGYYRTKNPIGKSADFITSSEISQVFGEILAAYLLQIASAKQNKIALVEMGAGKGTLFCDILKTIYKLAAKDNNIAQDFLLRASFHIIEINEALIPIQKQNLTDFSVNWYKDFDNFLKNSQNEEIFFISNELFDCFPIDQYILSEVGWRERVVIPNQDSKFGKFSLAEFDKKIHEFVEKQINKIAPIGAVFEYSLEARKFTKQLCDAINKKGGIAINIDYGYDKQEFANSLQAIKNHKKCQQNDILKDVGQADITALVDFSALTKIVKDFNLPYSLVSQGEFLKSLGIEKRRQILLKNNPNRTKEINSSIDRLIDSVQMGELFKFLIIWKQ